MVGVNKKLFSHLCGSVLFHAQRRKCFYCGQFVAASKATRDHLIPKKAGRNLSLNNVMACRCCNLKKGCDMPSERAVTKARALYARMGAPAFAVGA